MFRYREPDRSKPQRDARKLLPDIRRRRGRPSSRGWAARRGTWAVEINKRATPTKDKGFHIARADLKPDKAFVVYAGTERYPKAEGIEAIGLRALADELAGCRSERLGA